MAKPRCASSTGSARRTSALLDIRLPGIWGTDLLRHIKREPRLSRIKVAVLTGLSPGEFELEARPDEFLAKPVDVESLRAALTRMCA